MEYEQGDVVICTVDKIAGTTVFVKIDGTKKQGTIVMSEIAPGRIRNLREYVVPKKTIICKILAIKNEQIELSLRRVKEKERKEVMEQFKLEKSYKSIFKSILKEKTQKIINQIKEKYRINEFLNNAKENPKELEEMIGEEDTKKILEILKAQKTKTVSLKKTIHLTTTQSNGLTLIKGLLENQKEVEIKYIAAGKYSIKREDKNLKQADFKIKEIADEIEKKAKDLNMDFRLK